MPETLKNEINDAPLGKTAENITHYKPDLLFAIPRQLQRNEIGVTEQLPFYGFDLWNAYEISWLNKKGKPEVAIGEFCFTADSPHLVESKSLKLYLNSLTNTIFESSSVVRDVIAHDLSRVSGGALQVVLHELATLSHQAFSYLAGTCLDGLDVACGIYQVDPTLLQLRSNEIVSDIVHSNLLKANCLITGQPDWASIEIHYQGPSIDHASLLRYLISYRNHNEFHEQCVERIFMDIMKHCQPQQLTVQAFFTRRGGLDINPIRSTQEISVPKSRRLIRQ